MVIEGKVSIHLVMQQTIKQVFKLISCLFEIHIEQFAFYLNEDSISHDILIKWDILCLLKLMSYCLTVQYVLIDVLLSDSTF